MSQPALLWPQGLAAVVAVTRLFVSARPSNFLGSQCWRDGFDDERCCVKDDAACWDAMFTRERCCLQEGEAGSAEGLVLPARWGNPRCWTDGYTYDDCCVDPENPKKGCWDGQYGPDFCCVAPPESNLSSPLDVTEQEYAEAFLERTGLVADAPLGCPSDLPTPGFWATVKRASVMLNVSRQYGMPGEKPGKDDFQPMVEQVRAWVQAPAKWLEARKDCPAGALNAIDIVVAHVDREFGAEEAGDVYMLHRVLWQDLHGSDGGWAPSDGWPLLGGPMLEHVPRMLGLLEPHDCHGSRLRIYMYSVDKLAHMTKPALTCSQKMPQCVASVHIHKYLEQGSCLTQDPEEADLFYVPAYEACYNETACGFDNNTERCFPRDFAPREDLPYFGRRNGADHVFVFGCNLLAFADPLMVQARHSIIVTVESFQAENYDGPNMFAWFSHWKDVLIPGYLPSWRISAMLAFNRPMIERTLLLCFHGHSSSSVNVGHMYKRSPLAEVRDLVGKALWNASGASVGPPVRDYFRRMGLSRFCLVPAGLTAWTIHLYEAFFFGCVPVILSDELTVPFQGEIDWPSLSLQVPTSVDMAELHAHLASFSLGRLKAMYRALAAARCWLDYSRRDGTGAASSGDAGCSPYKALLSALAARRAALDSPGGPGGLYGLPSFWAPEPRT